MARPKKIDIKPINTKEKTPEPIIAKELENKTSIADTLNKERLEQYKTKEKYYLELIGILSTCYNDEIKETVKGNNIDLKELKQKINTFIEDNKKKIEEIKNVNNKDNNIEIKKEPSKQIFNGSFLYN